MGCGLISQRAQAVEVHRPLPREPGRAAGARSGADDAGADASNAGRRGAAAAAAAAAGVAASGSGHGPGHEARSPQTRAAAGAAGSSGGSDVPRGRGQPGRRFVMGERVLLTSRLPGNRQDHAFCFECGVFFQLGGTSRTPQCTRCGSDFVQYLRGAGDQHWIGAEGTAGRDYSFDDQLDNSISASLDEAPMPKTPTAGTFLRSLPMLEMTEADVAERSKLATADPRCHCAICREAFILADRVRQLPCSHEFHESCIITWLQSNNTCPICRWKLPQAIEGEEDAEAVREESGAAPQACAT